MWRYDLGWNMDMGIWFIPAIVFDLDGDGKAEVAMKSSEYDLILPFLQPPELVFKISFNIVDDVLKVLITGNNSK